MKDNENLNYWFCEIGPIDKNRISRCAGSPLRSVVVNKFIDMFGEQPKSCSSGWGLTEEMRSRLDIISYLPLTNPNGEILKEIDNILSKRK
jgi:hypothetical protein